MIPSATTILRLRFAAVVVVRLAALYLLVRGLGHAYDYFVSIMQHATHSDVPFLNSMLDSFAIVTGDWNALAAFRYVAAAAVLILLERRLIAWLVPAAHQRCPACGFAADRLTSPRCPECGVPLPPQWVERPPAEPRP